MAGMAVALMLAGAFLTSGCARIKQYSVDSWQGPLPMTDIQYVEVDPWAGGALERSIDSTEPSVPVRPAYVDPVRPADVAPVRPADVAPVRPIYVDPVRPADVPPTSSSDAAPAPPINAAPVPPADVPPVPASDPAPTPERTP
jgi:hypothetical protein